MCAARANLEDNHQQKKLPTERVGVNPGQDIGIKIPFRRKYYCGEPGCRRGYFYKSDMTRHVKKFHGHGSPYGADKLNKCDLAKHEEQFHEDEFKFFCDEPGCGRGFSNKNLLFNHKRRFHNKLKCQDSECSALLPSSSSCLKHMWVKHGIGKGPKCDQCGKREPSVEYLRGHERAVHGAPKLQCRESGCNYNCNYNTDMYGHIKNKHR